jgi:hypothetical protein
MNLKATVLSGQLGTNPTNGPIDDLSEEMILRHPLNLHVIGRIRAVSGISGLSGAVRFMQEKNTCTTVALGMARTFAPSETECRHPK